MAAEGWLATHKEEVPRVEALVTGSASGALVGLLKRKVETVELVSQAHAVCEGTTDMRSTECISQRLL